MRGSRYDFPMTEREIIEAIAAMPESRVIYDTLICNFCLGDQEPGVLWDDPSVHEENCPFLAARRLTA